MAIESIEDIPTDIKKYKCKCDKTGIKFERIKKKDFAGMDEKPSNTESAFCDEEIVKFKKFLKANGHGGDCWCKFIKEYVNAGI